MKNLTSFATAMAVATFVKNVIGGNLMGASMKIARPLDKKDIYIGRGANRTATYARFFNGDESNITKVTEYTNVTFERSYKQAVLNRIFKNLKAQGTDVKKSDIDFTPDSMSGMVWVQDWENILAQGIKNPDQYYLRVAMNANSKVKTTYLINGKEATEEELAIIKADLKPAKRDYTKQYEAGVAEGDEVDVFVTKIQNICYVKRGDKGITLK